MATNADIFELYMLDLINEERTSRGLGALMLETNLNMSAEEHSKWMIESDIFSHTGENGSSATDRIREELDLTGSWRTAENIAVQSVRGADGFFDDVEDLHTSLMNSEGHRANLLNPNLEYIGIGIELGDFEFSGGREFSSIIVTQNFATTASDVDLDPGTSAPIDDPVEEPVDDPVEEPIDDPVEEPIDEPIDDPVEEPTIPVEPEAVELLVNGSFESVDFRRSWTTKSDDDVDGWHSLNGERLEFWNSGRINGVESSDGSVHSEIDFNRSGETDGIYQDVDTVEGETYTLTFDLRSRHDDADSESEALYVVWDGELIEANGFTTSEAQEWETFTIEVEGTGDTERLIFRESEMNGGSDGRGPLLDNVSLIGPVEDFLF